MARIIVITSGKGGVGKTTSAINIGMSLNSFGKNVLIVDANLTTPNVGIHIGAPSVPIAFQHVLAGKNKVKEAVYEHHSGTKIMPASLSLESLHGIKEENINKTAKQLKKLADIIIFDSAAGLGREVELIMNVADELIVITNPELPAVTDALKAIKLAEDLGKSVTGIVVTKTRGEASELSRESIQQLLERPIIATIPDDISVRESLMQKDAVVHTHPDSDAAIAYKKLAAKLIGRRYVHEKKGFFDKFWKKIGIK